jgi:hypothetical protein
VQSGNTYYNWTFGNGDSSMTTNAIYTYPKPGQYTPCLYVRNAAGCFSKSCSKSITIKPCMAKFTKSIDTTQKFKIFLINNSSNTATTTYNWDFGDGGSSTSRNPSHKYNTFGKFKVCLTVKDTDCSSVFCDTLGLDSSGKLLKAGAFEIIVLEQTGSIKNKKTTGNFKIFPNPASAELTIDLSNSQVNYNKIEIVDAIGQICTSQTLERGSNTINLDLTTLKSGLYFIRISNAQNYSYAKFIKN